MPINLTKSLCYKFRHGSNSNHLNHYGKSCINHYATRWYINEHNVCSVTSKPSQSSNRSVLSFKDSSALLNDWEVKFTKVHESEVTSWLFSSADEPLTNKMHLLLLWDGSLVTLSTLYSFIYYLWWSQCTSLCRGTEFLKAV